MTWVRSDDRKPLNRKVRPLSDPAYRLDDHALHYCARHETDGVIHASDMEEIILGLKGRQHPIYISELLGAGLWHGEGESCDSRDCPASEQTVAHGTWVKHDYFVYNKRHSELEAARQSDRTRKRNPRGIQPESDRNPGWTPDRTPNTPSRPVPSRPVTGVENPSVGSPSEPAVYGVPKTYMHVSGPTPLSETLKTVMLQRQPVEESA